MQFFGGGGGGGGRQTRCIMGDVKMATEVYFVRNLLNL